MRSPWKKKNERKVENPGSCDERSRGSTSEAEEDEKMEEEKQRNSSFLLFSLEWSQEMERSYILSRLYFHRISFQAKREGEVDDDVQEKKKSWSRRIGVEPVPSHFRFSLLLHFSWRKCLNMFLINHGISSEGCLDSWDEKGNCKMKEKEKEFRPFSFISSTETM